MKKIILVLITFLLLTSCGTKRRVHSRNNKSVKRTIVKDNKTVVVNPIKDKATVKVKEPLYIDVSENKTFFDLDLLDVLYANKPNLLPAKIDYIKKYSELAIHEMETYKIPASITLAQGLLESRYGQSVLTKNAKNHFGIKCHKWTGGRIYHDDDAKGECFRKYEMHESSFRDHSLFLSHKKRYAKLFTFSPKDYKSWAIGLRKAGYATDKKYPQKLIALIEEYELYYFDNLVLGEEYVFKEETKEETKEEIKELKPNKVEEVKWNKNSKFYTVGTNETLYSISRTTKISVSDIKKFNNLSSDQISIGQQIQLFQSKTNTDVNIKENKEENDLVKKYKKHIVKPGDTIYSIARNNNTTVNDLIKINKLESNSISIGQSLIVAIEK